MGVNINKLGTRLCILWLSLSNLAAQNQDVMSCNGQLCWEAHEQANIYYQADVDHIDNMSIRKCIVLRTYKTCLNNQQSSGCSGDLIYQSARRALLTQMRHLNCSETGPIYPEWPASIDTKPTKSVSQPCRFRGRSVYSFCSLFGDPHLRTFQGTQQTCKLVGAWPLLDNEFLTVQVSNSLVNVEKHATVVQKLTVVVKGPASGDCGSRDAVFYHAEPGSLPSAFTDGQTVHGAHDSIRVTTITPGEQVEIYLRYLDTTVVVRQTEGLYLSVGVRMPEEVLNGTLRQRDSKSIRQLCLDSCPLSEVISLSEYFRDSPQSSEQQTAYQRAEDLCRQEGITDSYFDSCVFDLLVTERDIFAKVAKSAYEDAKNYASRQPRWANRTHLDSYRTSSPSDNVPSHSATLISHFLPLTMLFVYIMHILLSCCGVLC